MARELTASQLKRRVQQLLPYNRIGTSGDPELPYVVTKRPTAFMADRRVYSTTFETHDSARRFAGLQSIPFFDGVANAE